MRGLPRVEAVIAGAFAVLVLAYACLMAFVRDGFLGPRVGYGPDSQVYMDAAYHPVWTLEFLAARGPFLFPLLAKLSARNLRAIVVVQSVLYAGAWIFLATSIRALVRDRRVQVAVFGAVLLAGLMPTVLAWNVIISTESLAVSVLCVVLACALRLTARPGRSTAIAFVAALAAFAFVRDTNALTALLLGVAALFASVWWRSRRRLVAGIGAAAVGLAAIALVLSGQSEPPRWYYPLHETIAMRLVGDPVAEPYFVDHGLPLDEHLRALSDNYFIVVTRLDEGEEFAALREWVRDEGRQTYVSFLVRHPWWTLSEPVPDRDRFLAPDLDGYRAIWHIEPPGIYWIGALGFPDAPLVVTLWAIAATVGLAAVARRDRRVRPIATTTGIAGLLAIAGFYAAWHGDALEIDRHSLTAATQFRLALWIATALVADAIVRRPSVEHAHDAGDDREVDQGARGDDIAAGRVDE